MGFASTMPATETRNAEACLYVALQKRACKIAVMGLGYVGLPMAVAFAYAGFPVVGIEIDVKRCQQLAKGKSYIEDLPDTEIQAVSGAGPSRNHIANDVARRGGCCVDLCADPVKQIAGTGYDRDCGCYRSHCRPYPLRPTDRSGKHHVPRHDRRSAAAAPGTVWIKSGQRLFSCLLFRAH